MSESLFEQAITLKDVNNIYDFTLALMEMPCDVDLTTSDYRYIVNAKSIVGVFSLCHLDNLVVKAHIDKPELIKKLNQILKPYVKETD